MTPLTQVRPCSLTEQDAWISWLRIRMRAEVTAAEAASKRYRRIDQELEQRYPDRAAYLTRRADSRPLADAASAWDFASRQAGMYAAALQGEAAYEQLQASGGRA